MALIHTLDGKSTLVASDDHFLELIRQYMGDEAGEWYASRIGRVDECLDAIRSYSPPNPVVDPERPCVSATLTLDAIGKWFDGIDDDTRCCILWDMLDIPGWNE